MQESSHSIFFDLACFVKDQVFSKRMTFYQLVNLLNNLLHHTAHNSSHVYSFPRQAFFWYQILQLRERKKMQKSSPQPPSPLYSPHHQCNLSQPSPLVDINCNLSSSFSTSSISFFFFPFRHHLSHLEIYMNFWRVVGLVMPHLIFFGSQDLI